VTNPRKRRAVLIATLSLALGGAAFGCGKYGPPVRTSHASSPGSADSDHGSQAGAEEEKDPEKEPKQP